MSEPPAGGCCGGPGESACACGKPPAGRGGLWKNLAFFAVIVAALAIAAHGAFRKPPVPADGIVVLPGRDPQAIRDVLRRVEALLGLALMTAFSLGYGLPVAGALIGLGFGFRRLKSMPSWAGPAVRVVSGAALLGIGFYMLASV